MTKYLEQNIKDLIETYPPLGALLDSYKIGCVGCQAGSCKLKDIVEIHNLPPATEEELFIKMMAIIEPGRKPVLPPRREKKSDGGPLRYSPPLRMLVEEHVQIKHVLALIPRLAELLQKDASSAKTLAEETLFFVQNYADRYHHAKEEDILFQRFNPAPDIIRVMLEEHNSGRSLRKEIAGDVEKGNGARAAANLLGFQKLLTEHIRKEDEILYPWMDRTLTDRAIGEIFTAFNELEPKFTAVKERCLGWAAAAEDRLMNRKPADIELDLRPLPPPRRHALIFETWQKLPAGSAFKIINDHDPKPLQYMFAAEYAGQFTWAYEQAGPVDWIVRIQKL